MSKFYNPERSYDLYDPQSKAPYKLSRYKIEQFISCPFCFYLDIRFGIAVPPLFPLTLNVAVDKLLKKEFDIYRARGLSHPAMKRFKIGAVPFQHPKINEWRNPKVGIRFHHQLTNFIIYGGVDDVWINPRNELIIVDYKATSKNSVLSIDADWQKIYKRQIEVYQWLFRQNGFKVSRIGYFVYCNARTDKEVFDAKLEFDIQIIPYEGDDSWVEGILLKIKKYLLEDKIPPSSENCDFCQYRQIVKKWVSQFKLKFKKAGLKDSGPGDVCAKLL